MPAKRPLFRTFVGHRTTVDSLLSQLRGAQALGEPFPPTLFSGPSGVGKTQLAESLAAEFGTNLLKVNGYATPEELASVIRGASAGDFVFVDEAQNLSAKAQDLLYEVIDRRQITTRLVDGSATEVPPVTIMLATDQPGRLHNALDKRMALHIALGYYSDVEIRAIIDLLAAEMGLLISPQAANALARVCWGIPRRARQHLGNLRRHVPESERRQLSVTDVRAYLDAFQIDSAGMGAVERRYLHFLREEGRASLNTISSHLGYDPAYVERQIEPILRRAMMFTIGPGGRALSKRGTSYVHNLDSPSPGTT